MGCTCTQRGLYDHSENKQEHRTRPFQDRGDDHTKPDLDPITLSMVRDTWSFQPEIRQEKKQKQAGGVVRVRRGKGRRGQGQAEGEGPGGRPFQEEELYL
eukprot:CAMPEP_0168342806 /NCGR_PEP_ID=MMETSP0213-20121227/15640_1 /TAXON_ID=151035 /ORGANISM="Euplotes harpa, Strain FSP1.4" /LENGTH=99 /DNA_ID=CAMNT_0008349827 /DNA_START=14 /DNA_END=312 /DNA_ORIENTATION=+